MQINFGYWPQASSLTTNRIRVEPLPNFREMVDSVRKSCRVANSWLYPPLRRLHSSNAETDCHPDVPASAFSLPSTHSLVLRNCEESNDREFAEFVIAVAGLLTGLRLIPSDWSHFYKVAVEPGKLTDLSCTPKEIESVLETAERFWHEHQGIEVRRGIFGVIHWLLFAQSYEHEFEQFGAIYTALDAIFRLHCDSFGTPAQRLNHAERPAFLANQYSVPIPDWARTRRDSGKPVCDLSKLRNDFVHEARYAGEPIGFANPSINPLITLQLTSFCTRLILAILGVECGYIATSVDMSCMHGLDLEE